MLEGRRVGKPYMVTTVQRGGRFLGGYLVLLKVIFYFGPYLRAF